MEAQLILNLFDGSVFKNFFSSLISVNIRIYFIPLHLSLLRVLIN